MPDKPSIIFMGTPEFAVPSLEALHEEFSVRAVVTVPDKPKGRGKKLQPSPVKIKAEELGIEIFQPESLKSLDFIEEMQILKPDIMAVVAFRILPENLYSIAKLGAFNIHGSLLPKFRGAAPINWALIQGEKVTGLTSFILNPSVDTGEILLQKEMNIPENATAGDLRDLLMHISAELAVETVRGMLDDSLKPKKQNEDEATPAPKIFRDQCRLAWNKPAEKIKHFIHGVSPAPGAWCLWQSKRLKILRVETIPSFGREPGNYIIKNNEFHVQCSDGALKLTQIQPQGRKQMKASDFLRGYRGETEGELN